MAEIIIAKQRNGAVGYLLLRFKGEFPLFSNPEDDMIIPMPNAPAGMMGSRMNAGGAPPPPVEMAAPNVPFGNEPDGPLPF